MGVISVIITAIATIVVGRMNNRTLRSIQSDKFQSELIIYRYTKLYNTLERLEALEENFELGISYSEKYILHGVEHIDNEYIKHLSDMRNRFLTSRRKIAELSRLTLPLISNSSRVELNNAITVEDDKFRDLLESFSLAEERQLVIDKFAERFFDLRECLKSRKIAFKLGVSNIGLYFCS